MSESLVLFSLVILAGLTLLNLHLTLGLYKIINNPSLNVKDAHPVPIGEVLPPISARNLLGNQVTNVATESMPVVLLFLSSKCPTCKEKIPQIEHIDSHAPRAGVDIRLISTESKPRLKHFLKDSSLLHRVFITSRKDYKKLNPSLASPFYLFVDHDRQLQSFGTIGDSDWQVFVEQISSIDSEAQA